MVIAEATQAAWNPARRGVNNMFPQTTRRVVNPNSEDNCGVVAPSTFHRRRSADARE
jgi:hypothetical protein